MLAHIAVLVFILGTIIGSFLNVLILRYGKKDITGRSACPFCGKTLQWYELIPILSFIIQRGKCRLCESKISWQYPLVEFATGSIFVSVLFFLIEQNKVAMIRDIFTFSFVLSFFVLTVIWSVLIVIFVYDLYHKIIPDRFVFIFIGFSFFWLFFSVRSDVLLSLPDVWDLLMGGFLFLFFFSLWYISKGTWMGFGDAKLALGMGFLLGFSKGLSAFMLSFWIGALVALVLLSTKKLIEAKAENKKIGFLKNLTIKSEVPFAPFLIIGTAIAFFFSLDTLNLMSFLTFNLYG